MNRKNFHVVLSKTEGRINLGMTARVMSNFRIPNLIIHNPEVLPTDPETLSFAPHAENILYQAHTIASLEFLPKGITVALSRRSGQFRRADFSIQELKGFLSEKLEADPSLRINLLFGNESTGLSDEEIVYADYLCYIPTEGSQQSLNLSHAVCVVLYELNNISFTNVGQQNTTVDDVHKCTVQFLKILDILNYFNSEKEKKERFSRYLYKLFSRGIRQKEDALVFNNLFMRIYGRILKIKNPK